MNSGLYEVPGFSATWMAAARASWFALPVTKLSNVKPRLRRARSSAEGAWAASRCAAREHELQAALPAARLGGETLYARGKALAHQLEHESVGGGQHERVVRGRFGCERPDPGVELLRGEFLLEPTQAGVPEVLHRV